MSDFSSAIDAALAIESRDAFMHAVADLDEGYSAVPYPERTDPLGMLGGLWALHLMVSLDGIGRFLAEPGGTAFHETIDSCQRVGAEQAAAYLRAVAALYPGGRVPTDDEDRYAVLARLEGAIGPDPLRALDRKYAGAMDDLADRVRDWLRAHRGEVERALEEASRGPAPPERSADRAAVDELIAQLERQARQGPP